MNSTKFYEVEHFERFESYIPVDLTQPSNFLMAAALVFGIIVFRYFLTAGLFWLFFYRLNLPSLKNRQIYDQLPSRNHQLFEMKWSILSSVIFALGGAVMGLMWQVGWTKLYLKFNQYGWAYLILSLFIISLIHDFYFYWTHRWLHIPSIFKRFHAVHHESITPSPWASFSFHPVEGFIQAIFLPLVVLFVPVHPVALIGYLTLMTISAVSNHLGFEILPRGSERGLARWLISGVHHSQHHRSYRSNYGLFYTFFDHIFKTENPNFERDFRNVFSKKAL